MVRKILMLLFGFTMTFSLWSQNVLERREEPGEVIWWLDENTVDKDKHMRSYYVENNNNLELYPGEEVWAEMELKGKKIKYISVVKENVQPDITGYFKLDQLLFSDGYNGEKVLTVENPFEAYLTFEVWGFIKAETKWEMVKEVKVNPNSKVEVVIKDAVVGMYYKNWRVEE